MERVRWFVFGVVFFFSLNAYTQNNGTAEIIVLNSRQQPLRFILNELSTQTDCSFIYSDDIVKNIKVSCKIKSNSVSDVLNKILNPFDISYKIFEANNIVLYKEEKLNREYYRALVIDNNIPNNEAPSSISKPTMISNNKLVYPLEAVRDKIEGNVSVRFLITGAGDVSKAIVVNSSGYKVLDLASINYVKSLKFLPAEANGNTQDVWMTMQFRFIITKN